MTVQKGAESTAETPDPADVKPGETWIVNIDGVEIVPGFKASVGWICYRLFDGTTKAIGDERITLVSRLVPAPRQVTTWEELDALALYTVIRGANEAVCEKGRQRPGCAPQWFQVGIDESESAMITLPATVLWEPEVAS